MVVEADGKVQEVPLAQVGEVLVIGNARISTAVLADLAERGVPLHFQRAPGRLPCSVQGPLDGRLGALAGQFAAGELERLRAARALVQAKVANSAWVLRRLKSRVVLPAADIATAPDAETLRGLEGEVARAYFAALSDLLPGWAFVGRAYRPAPDPVNAALSFAYAVLLGWTLAAVAREGLHPALGTLHVPHGRRPALALDVMEPFRAPVCDLTVLRLLRSGQLSQSRFQARGAEVRLGPAGCAVVVRALAERQTVWRLDAALSAQVQAVRQAWAGGECPGWTPPVRA